MGSGTSPSHHALRVLMPVNLPHLVSRWSLVDRSVGDLGPFWIRQVVIEKLRLGKESGHVNGIDETNITPSYSR